MRPWLPLILVLGCAPAVEPPALDPGPSPRGGATRLAGDGAATPLLRHLARTFADRVPGPALLVEAPLGAQGARRALRDGHLAAVISVGPTDRTFGVPIARTRPVLVAGPGVRLRHLEPAQLADTLLGRRPTWVDGLPRGFLLRDPDDPLARALAQAEPRIEAALAQAHTDRRWPVYQDDAELLGALRQTPGALAIADTGSLSLTALPLWTLRSVDAPLVDLRLELAERPSPRLQAFVSFVTGPVGRALIADLGYALPPRP